MLQFPRMSVFAHSPELHSGSELSKIESRLVCEAIARSIACGERDAVVELLAFVSGLSVDEVLELAKSDHRQCALESMARVAGLSRNLSSFLTQFVLVVIESLPDLSFYEQNRARVLLFQRMLSIDCEELLYLSADEVDEIIFFYERIRAPSERFIN